MTYDDSEFKPMRPERPHRRPGAKLFVLRNVLNTLFMIGALAGVVCYLAYSKTIGTYIVIGSLPLKFVEAALRLITGGPGKSQRNQF